MVKDRAKVNGDKAITLGMCQPNRWLKAAGKFLRSELSQAHTWLRLSNCCSSSQFSEGLFTAATNFGLRPMSARQLQQTSTSKP